VRLRLTIAIVCLIFSGLVRPGFAQVASEDSVEQPSLSSVEQSIRTDALAPIEQPNATVTPLSSGAKGKLLIWTTAFGFLGAIAVFFSGMLDWQRLKVGTACDRCLKVHRGAGSVALIFDSASVSILYYLLGLPIFAALTEEPPTLIRIAISTLLFLASLFGLVALGTVCQFLAHIRALGQFSAGNVLRSFLTGVRVCGFVFAVLLLGSGFSAEALNGQVETVFGTELGQRLLESIGAAPVLKASIALAIACLASWIFRWVVPIASGSRPLLFLQTEGTVHGASQLARI